MIHRLHKVIDGLYRGSAPSPRDVELLKNYYGINKIVSLDEESGRRIDKSCKLLNIKHIMCPIDGTKDSLLKFLHHDIKNLLLNDGPTFIHCKYGKDRTGLAVAIFKCKYMGEDPEMAIRDAKSLGFGLGLPEHVVNLYEKIIKSCKTSSDENNADIVSITRQPIGDNKDSPLDSAQMGSFSPYLSQTRQYPMDAVYNELLDQDPTRENYKAITPHIKGKVNVPLVGVYNNSAGIAGAGPSTNSGGFL
jgi:hypothetical protein